MLCFNWFNLLILCFVLLFGADYPCRWQVRIMATIARILRATLSGHSSAPSPRVQPFQRWKNTGGSEVQSSWFSVQDFWWKVQWPLQRSSWQPRIFLWQKYSSCWSKNQGLLISNHFCFTLNYKVCSQRSTIILQRLQHDFKLWSAVLILYYI